MKLSFISLVLSAGLAISQVSASPLRVVVVSNDKSAVPPHVRLGYPVPVEKNLQPIPVYNSLSAASAEMSKPKRMGCLRHKAVQVTNWIRITVGLPPFEPSMYRGSPPFDPSMYRNRTAMQQTTIVKMVPIASGQQTSHQQPHNQGFKYHVKHRSQAFIDRLTIALMMLGPWEGRAVAFVIGCGLGALLRMVWVLAVITTRAVRGRSQEDDDDDVVDVVIFEEEEHLLPPPQYEQSEGPRDVKEKVEN